LLSEQTGYVPAAVYKEGIGDIDFVWGKPGTGKGGYGLSHIIRRRNDEGHDGKQFVRELPALIKNGEIVPSDHKDRKYIANKNHTAIVRLDYDGKKATWLASAFIKKEDVEKAFEYYTIAWNMRIKIFGIEHPDTLSSHNNIAFVYSKQGKYEKALELHKNILKIKLANGGENPNTATSYNNIGACYYRLGNFEEALKWFHKSLVIHKNYFGDSSYETINVENNLRLTFTEAQIDNPNKYPFSFEEWQENAR